MIVEERTMLEQLVELGNRFRDTPIVDDDFPSLRDQFDSKLKEATALLKTLEPCHINSTRMIIDGCMGQQEVIVTNFNRRK